LALARARWQTRTTDERELIPAGQKLRGQKNRLSKPGLLAASPISKSGD